MFMGSPPSRRAARSVPALLRRHFTLLMVIANRGATAFNRISVVSHPDYINLAGAVSIQRANISTFFASKERSFF